jgi:N-acetylglucosaminyldiphosphoundecaprenol N-acetyl-beta-D-mannosaminyltransferase
MRIDLLGIPIDRIGMTETIDKIDEFIARGGCHLVATANVDHVIQALRDVEFRRIYHALDLSVVDGVPLLWAARFLGRPLIERVNGTDLFVRLCEHASQKGYRVFLLGAPPGVASRAASQLTRRFPGLQVVGTYAPPLGFDTDDLENQKIVEMIRQARPDILFVGLGAPKQEKWAHRHLSELNVPVIVGVGASFEYLAGQTRRAPRWMQRAGLEWLFRVASQPGRYWKRYLVRDVQFVPLLLREKLRLLASTTFFMLK